ncbi:MAG: LysR substrate-binding domain-containing protein [Pseudomonadota bacterium]
MNLAGFPDLSVRELLAVCGVARNGGFLAAALELNVSQPALTRSVQRVEQVLGMELFRRSTRRVEITMAGTEFVAVAERVLDDLRISFANIQQLPGELRGRIIISSVMSVAYAQLPGILGGYRQTHRLVEVQLREGVHGTVLDDVRSGVADLGITYIDDIPAGCKVVPLGQEVFHVVMPPDHPLAQQAGGITLPQLADCAMVSLPKDSQTRRMLDDLAAAAGFGLRHEVTVAQFATAMQCVRAGVGLAVMPGGAVPAALASGLAARPLLEPAVRRAIGAIALADRALSTAASSFLLALQEAWPGDRGTA